MSDQGQEHQGGCLCGAIRFKAEGDPLWVAYCHCHSCRRSTGAPVTTFVGYASERFSYLAGTPQGYHSSPGVTRSFCGQCGTPLTYEAEGSPGEVHAYISTFDEPDAFPPKLHVFVPEGISWLHIADQLPRFRETARGGVEPIAVGDSGA